MLGRAVVGIDIEAIQASVKEALKQCLGQRIAVGVDGNPALGTVLAGIGNKLGETFVEERFVHQVWRKTSSIVERLQLMDDSMVYLNRHEDFLDRELAGWTEDAATIAPGDSLDLDTREEGDGLRGVYLVYRWSGLSEDRHGMVSPFTSSGITLSYVSYHMPCVVPSERLSARRRIVRLCIIGDSPDVRRCAVALVEQGHQVYWLASTEALRTLPNEAAQFTVATDILPSTCQYVVPVQTYHYEGIRLMCVAQEF